MNTVITRNDVDFSLSKQVVGKKSPDHAGKEFYAPVGTLENAEQFIKWSGLDNILGAANKMFRAISFQIFLDNWDSKNGVLNEETWRADMADFTAGAATLTEIEEQLENLYALQQSYALDDAFGDGSEKDKELQAAITEVALKIKPLKAKKAQISEKYAAAAATRKANKAATETPVAA